MADWGGPQCSMHRWQSMRGQLFQEHAQLMVAPPPPPPPHPQTTPPPPQKSLFGQLYGEMEGWSNEKFRRWVHCSDGALDSHMLMISEDGGLVGVGWWGKAGGCTRQG